MQKFLFVLLLGASCFTPQGYANITEEAIAATATARTKYNDIVFYGGSEVANSDLSVCFQSLKASPEWTNYLADVVQRGRNSNFSAKDNVWLESYIQAMDSLSGKLNLMANYRKELNPYVRKEAPQGSSWSFDHWSCNNR